MDPIQIMLAYYAIQHGITEDAAAELLCEPSEDGNGVDRTKLKSDALGVLKTQDKVRVDKIKGSVDKTKIFNDAHAKAVKEERGKVEKLLAEKFELSRELELTELVDQIAAIKAPAGGELTEENVKKHPAFTTMEKTKTKEIEKLKTEYEAKLKDVETAQSKAKITKTALEIIGGYFDDLKPVLPADATKAANQRKKFLKEFENYTYEPIDGSDKDFLIIGPDGKRLEDGHNNPLSLKAFTQREAEPVFEFAVQDDKGGPGNGGKAGKGAVKVPTNEEEYNDAIFNATTAEERAAIADAYGAK